MIVDDPATDANQGQRVYCVRDVREPDLGVRESLTSPAWTLRAHGCGELWTSAAEEIRDRVDLEEHVGEEVATVTIDVDVWDYRIDWQVDVDDQVGLSGLAAHALKRVLGRDAA